LGILILLLPAGVTSAVGSGIPSSGQCGSLRPLPYLFHKVLRKEAHRHTTYKLVY